MDLKHQPKSTAPAREQAESNDLDSMGNRSAKPLARQCKGSDISDYRVSAKHHGLLASVFDASLTAVMVLNCDSVVIFMNTAAQNRLKLQDNISLSNNGHVRFDEPETQFKFRDLIARAATGRLLCEPHVLPVTIAGKVVAQLRIYALLSPPDSTTTASVVVTYSSLVRCSFDKKLARQLFRLSRAELAICTALTSGHLVHTIAAERGTSIETVHSQLTSIFSKTNTHSQHSLVSLLLTATALPLFATL